MPEHPKQFVVKHDHRFHEHVEHEEVALFNEDRSTHGLKVVKFPFDFSMHEELAAGILVATIPDGAVIPGGGLITSIVENFDGEGTPTVNVSGSQVDSVEGGSTFMQSLGGDQLDSTNNYIPAAVWPPTSHLVYGGDLEVWLALTDGDGNDALSTEGSGLIIVTYI